MKASWETRFLVPAFLILFVGLGILSVFLLIGESSRARILVEYEADRTALALGNSFRAEGSLDPARLDPRIRGFGLYAPNGDSIVRVGDAPDVFDVESARAGFRYDRMHGLLTLRMVFGPGGPGMMGPEPGPGHFMMGMPGMGLPPHGGRPFGGFRGTPHGPAGALFLAMDISSYYRLQFLYRTAAVVAPVAVAGIAALFLLLLSSNIRHRRVAQEQQTLARLGESARTLAHEIRNPLSAIRIQTGLLRKRLGGNGSAQLDAIDEEVERLSLLSHRVGDFLKNPVGSPQRIVVEEFLAEIAGKLPVPVSFTTAPSGRGAAVSFDGDLLRSVMENLVRNAHESYPDADGRCDVEVALLREKTSVVIAVRDRGKGIAPELLEKVFDPFFTDKVHGSGVGLSLSRRFVEAAGGTLTLAARNGGGTEARIALPARSAE
ncbi:MAG: ATP-binding protein [Spirochaetia bacterium]|jgi:signal transduction histidine kinase